MERPEEVSPYYEILIRLWMDKHREAVLRFELSEQREQALKKEADDIRALNAEAIEIISLLVSNHGNCSYLSDEEKDAEDIVIRAKKLLISMGAVC